MRHIGWVTGYAMAAVNVVCIVAFGGGIWNYAGAVFCASIGTVSILTTTRRYR